MLLLLLSNFLTIQLTSFPLLLSSFPLSQRPIFPTVPFPPFSLSKLLTNWGEVYLSPTPLQGLCLEPRVVWIRFGSENVPSDFGATLKNYVYRWSHRWQPIERYMASDTKIAIKTFKHRNLPMEPPMETTVRPSDYVSTNRY